MERALLIEFDISTGRRAGNINPRDPNLRCRGWQNLDSKPALEIRLVEDDRDLSPLEGMAGVTVLEGRVAINKAIQANIPIKYGVSDKELLLAHMKEKGISVATLAGKQLGDSGVCKELYNQRLAGITKREIEMM